MYASALEILKKISLLGYKAYIVGGYPRNMLLCKQSLDIDICTSASPEILKKHFDVEIDNSKYGSLKMKYNEYLYEITTFRIETNYKGRYPEIEYTDKLEIDLQRRDFTINTICIDENENIIDLLNGMTDLNNKTIRIIGNPDERLMEDPIRILRAIRFSKELNFKIEKELENSIIKNGYLLETITKTQLKREIDKINDISLIHKYHLEQYMKGVI